MKFIRKTVIITIFMLIASIQSYSQWERVTNIPAPFDKGYYLEVVFLESNPQYGWICGYNGFILRTTDGGENWAGVTLGLDIQLESINFVNEKVGFTSGQLRSPIDVRGKLYKTEDGGISWTDITPIGFNPVLWGNYFLDENRGMVIGGGCDSQQHFYRTTNGGSSWALASYEEFGTGLCDLILYDFDGIGYASSSGRIWRTNNGGRTWAIFSMSGGADWQEELSIKGKTFLVPYSTECSGGGGTGGARISTDNALNWIPFHTGVPMFGTFLHDELRGWAVGHEASIYYTKDGGKNWSLRNCGVESYIDLDDIYFIDDTTGWTVGDGVYRFYEIKAENPVIVSNDDLTICEGDSVVLTTDKYHRIHIWSTGDTSSSITVKKPGWYWLLAGNTICDTATSERIYVDFSPDPGLNIMSDKAPFFCEGDSITLTALPDFNGYIWNTGETGKSITVFESGDYIVSITDSNGCVWDKSIAVTVYPMPEVSLSVVGKTSVCVGDTIQIIASGGYPEYEWFRENETAMIQRGGNIYGADKTGNYYVKVTSSEGCSSYSDTVFAEIRLDTNKLMFSFSPNESERDFGVTVYPDLNCRTVEITNISWSEVTIDEVFIIRNIAFSIPQAQFPIVIPPYETIELEVCHSPTDHGFERDTILLPDLCSGHIMPLKALSDALIHEGDNRCDNTLRASIRGNRMPYVFVPAGIFPNPASEKLSIPFEIYIPNSMSGIESCRLYDYMGNIAAQAEKVIKSSTETEYGELITGEFRIGLDNVRPGAYFVHIQSPGGDFRYTVIVRK